jgi:hypothetical protein
MNNLLSNNEQHVTQNTYIVTDILKHARQYQLNEKGESVGTMRNMLDSQNFDRKTL